MTLADLYGDPVYTRPLNGYLNAPGSSWGFAASPAPSSYEFNQFLNPPPPPTVDQQLLAKNYRQSQLARDINMKGQLAQANRNIGLLNRFSYNPNVNTTQPRTSPDEAMMQSLVQSDVNARQRGLNVGTAEQQKRVAEAKARQTFALNLAKFRNQVQQQGVANKRQDRSQAIQLANTRRQQEKDIQSLALRKRSQDLRAGFETARLQAQRNIRNDASLDRNYKEAAALVVGGMDPAQAADTFGITDPSRVSRLNSYRDLWQAKEDQTNRMAAAAVDSANRALQSGGTMNDPTFSDPRWFRSWRGKIPIPQVPRPLRPSDVRGAANIVSKYRDRVVQNPDGSYSVVPSQPLGLGGAGTGARYGSQAAVDEELGLPAVSSPRGYGGPAGGLEFDGATGLPIVRTPRDLESIPAGREFLDVQGRRGRKNAGSGISQFRAPLPAAPPMSLNDLYNPEDYGDQTADAGYADVAGYADAGYDDTGNEFDMGDAYDPYAYDEGA